MPQQKTNLNVSPYYDDFEKLDNYYRVLFKPGYPVQARELTGLQSILQNQIASFGEHMFKEGSMVIPGGITCDNAFTTIKVNPLHLGIDITVYLDAMVNANNGSGTKVKGLTSGATGTIKGYILPPDQGVEQITLFVKYAEGADDGENTVFQNGEVLNLLENITYGNTTLVEGDTAITLVSEEATATGYAVGVAQGVYFIRGIFVDVPNSQIVLDPYDNEVSYRVGFDIVEEVVNSDQEPQLNDNARGFTNYAAPGADRLKISVRLAKKQLTDYDDTNFVELVKIDEGKIKKLQNKSEYNLIKDYFAKRTFEESGNYAVDSFIVDTAESLDNETGNGGLFREGDVTDEGNTPTKDLMAVTVSAGTAYVRGYDVDLVGSTVVDVEKPRTEKHIPSSLIDFSLGSLITINNVHGVPYINVGDAASGANSTNTNIIKLFNARRDASTVNGTNLGTQIGMARVYWYGVSDASYTGDSTQWDLYLYDIQTFTSLTVGTAHNGTNVPDGSLVRGLSSGATGFVSGRNSTRLDLSQTSGEFLEGEQIIINDDVALKDGIKDIVVHNTEDIKSVFQDTATISGVSGQGTFLADTVLYPRALPDFGATDTLQITGTTGKVAGRFFNKKTGFKAGAIIRYQDTNAVPQFNVVSSINAASDALTLAAAPDDVAGVCNKSIVNPFSGTFDLMVPHIRQYGSNGLYSTLPVANISSVDLANSQITITKQITGKSTDSNGELEIGTADVIDIAAGITSVFYETFDAERYSIHYHGSHQGKTEELTSGNFEFGPNGESVKFTGLSHASTAVTVIATLTKKNVTSKSVDFVRSQTLAVNKTQKSKAINGLTNSKFYGLRVEDQEISLNVPDVVNVRAVYESTTENAPVLDTLTFATGLSLDTEAIVGEKIVGQESRAVGQVVGRTANTITYIPLNTNDFFVEEDVKFKDSSISAVLQKNTKGSYVDKTANYRLEKGQRHQFCDYSRLVRRPGSPTPTRQLLVVFDKFKLNAGSTVTGDLLTVNSYGKDRFTSDIPALGNGLRVSDIIDFRPRVKEFTSTTASPFAFESRQYETTYSYVLSPDETTFVGYKYYLPRIDMVTINKDGEVEVVKGAPADIPQAPILADDAMEIAQVLLPPYVYNANNDPAVLLRDNRRFTMRDIGKLEDRIETLEEMTSLSMLEMNAKTLEVTDANGLSRFKSGFIVSDFRDRSLADPRFTTIDIDKANATAIAPVDTWSMTAEPAFDSRIDVNTADLSQNLLLQDTNIQKTGDMLTLAYEEVDWLTQIHATEVKNVNPFNVIVFVGGVVLDPASDNWVRTIYIDDHRTESTGAKWKQEATVTKDVDKKTEYVTYKKGGGRGERKTRAFTTTTITTTTKFKPKLRGPSREFDYVENVKVSGEADPWMRSRNVYFNANGLRPFQKHYHFLDSQQVDIVPKLCQISMVSGTFQVFEDAHIIHRNGKKVGFIRIQRPNHKFGDTKRPDIGAGLGSPAVLVEEYQVNPYDKDAPAPGNGYSPTSELINFGVRSLANLEKYFGYVEKGFKVVGATSGAVAEITRADLVTDNWGDVVAAFFFRNPNSKPQPPYKLKSGTKAVKITAVPPNTVVLPGSTIFASEAIGQYSGSGTILTQETSRVSVRNPPKPPRKKTQVEVEVKAPHRDPLAQSFTVDGQGVFLTSFDLYFASKDPSSKVFVELRTMELGIPTNILVQDYTQVALNPQDIVINEADPFNPLPTRVRFPSPVYLEKDREYAIVILSPGSDLYEMWTARMGGKTVNTSSLPDVDEVVVSKQYIGGSLFESQNGTIWTPNQMSDLTFKLYKAKFKKSGTLTWHNPDVTPKGDNAADLNNNPIQGLPRKLKLPVTGTLNAAVVPGIRIGETQTGGITGYVENIGAPIATQDLTKGGSGYVKSGSSITGVGLFSITGQGTGAVATINTDADGKVSSVTVTNAGTGYVKGEILGITTSTLSAANRRGSGARVTVKTLNATEDTLYLTDVQGENFTNSTALFYYTDPLDESTRTNNTGVTVNGTSSLVDARYTGNVFSVKQFNHGHHGGNNRISIVDIEPDTTKTEVTADLDLTGTVVSVANTTIFANFEGITTSRGYALLGNEIISYNGITETSAPAGQLTITARGLNDSPKTAHSKDAAIQPYEVNGVSLMRINTSIPIPATSYKTDNSNVDNYYLEFDRSTPINRSSGASMLNFESEKGMGGNTVGISQNYQFSVLEPMFNVITPGKGTKIEANIRTISGTSAGGRETSFIDQGFEAVTLNKPIYFDTPRMVASKENETARLDEMPRNKSLTLRVDFATQNEDLSPMMDTQNATFVLGRNKSNKPIDDYVEDARSNAEEGDPHGAVFVTKAISLAQPATSLKVIIAANRQEDADFRVLYKLFKADSTEVEQKFVPFPGYDNLDDTDGDGFGDRVRDPNKNSGRADAFVPASDKEGFSEYQFSANNLDEFTAFSIKVVLSSANESTPVKLKDFRAIALA